MKSERFGKTKSVVAASAIALVVAALTFGISSQVVHPAQPKMSLTAGSGFLITSSIYASPACSGPTVDLYPGTTDCIVFNVHNNLTAPISVGSITMGLSNPNPPTGCSATDLSLPTFTGTLSVPGSGSASTSGLPIMLKDDGNQSPQCENQTLNFTYSGTAQYTDSTSTTLASSSPGNTSTAGSSVTFTATVTGANASSDASAPSGTVTFYSCPSSSSCTAPTSTLGTGPVGATGQATLSISTLPAGSTFLEAVYGGSGTNFTGSTSGIITQVVTSGSHSTSTALTSSANPSNAGQSVTFTATVSSSSGTPAGTVTFYSCTTNTCGTKSSLGTGTLSSGKATLATSTLPVGTTYVEAVYGASGSYTGSTSPVVTQVVKALATTSSLTSSANPSNSGSSVTFTDTVSASSGTPAGSVTFYSCTTNTCGTTSALGTGSLSSGKATLATSTLPVGTTYVEAVYGGSGSYTGSTSNVVTQVVKAVSIATSTALTASPNPSNIGQSVSFTATVSSGSGTPAGSVTFYSCTTNACGAKTSLGTGTLSSGKATLATSSLPVGTTYVEAVYGGSGSFAGSTSNVVAQVVKALSTTSNLTSSPNPSITGSSVTLTDTVTASSGTPAGSVTFYSCTDNTCGTKTSLGTGTISSGKTTLTTSSLPAGTTDVEAVYGGSGSYLGSTSNVVAQTVLSVPSSCAAGGYSNVVNGTPGSPFIFGTNGNDLMYAFGASYWIDGFAGNDCIDAGDGNNVIFDGDGNDAIIAGNGWDTVVLGDGNDKVSLGNGSDGVQAGDGNDTVTVGNGSQSQIIVGNGNDTVTVGSGSSNQIELGRGTDTVTIQSPGSHDAIDGGNGNETVYLGSGSYNTYNGQAHHTNVCHLPKPSASWHGTAAAYYHDTLTNCSVVSP